MTAGATAQKSIGNPKDFLRQLFDRAVEVADPMRSLAAHLPDRPTGRVVVVGAGKGSARMAEAVEAEWGPCEGLVITRYGYGCPCDSIEIAEAAHPVPDKAGVLATERMLTLLEGLGESDFVLALVSGGASALLVKPCEGVSLSETQAVHSALLNSGAPIDQMNIVRKHLSGVSGGKLAAAAYPAPMLTLIISDVPGDDPAFIGSGPTIGDGTTAAEIARSNGCDVKLLGDALEGEASDFAKQQADMALKIRASRKPNCPPLVLLSGGELTVFRTGNGTGGPNVEYCLALALALDGQIGIHAIACDTDGVDGGAEVAGAYVDADTLLRAKKLGISATNSLANNDAHGFFKAIDQQIVTGPTLTNVNDFRATLITW